MKTTPNSPHKPNSNRHFSSPNRTNRLIFDDAQHGVNNKTIVVLDSKCKELVKTFQGALESVATIKKLCGENHISTQKYGSDR